MNNFNLTNNQQLITEYIEWREDDGKLKPWERDDKRDIWDMNAFAQWLPSLSLIITRG